jgi:hypothetical protein
LASIRLGPAKHHSIETVAVLQHFSGLKQSGVQELRQHPELKVIALMRRGR